MRVFNRFVSNNRGAQGAVSSSVDGGVLPPSMTKKRRPPVGRRRRYETGRGALADRQFFPRLILAQITAVQCFHYVGLGVAVQFNHLLFGATITLDRIFTSKHLDVHAAEGWIDNTAILASWGIVGPVMLLLIVEKSKKCLDFGATCFIIHLMVCTAYEEFPKTVDWWIVNIIGVILMIVLGEYLCSRIELRDIPLLPL